MKAWLFVAVAGAAGCLSDPGGGGAIDGAPPDIDAPAPIVDAAPPDAPRVEGGEVFPPADTIVNITAGWAGDLNGDRFDDLVLLSDTGEADSAGAYVLFGGDGGAVEFHQFLGTDIRDPIAVAGVQLDGTGKTDIVVFGVDYGDGLEKETIQTYLLAYLGDGAPYRATPLENHVTSVRENWLFPRTPGLPADIAVGRFAPGAQVPGLAVVHERGAFGFAMSTWGESAFEGFPTAPLLPSFGSTGAHVAPNADDSNLDDIVVYTSSEPTCRWLVNDGDGTFTPVTIESSVPGIHYGEPAELVGGPPVDFVGVRASGIQGVPVDQDVGTAGSLLDGVTSVSDLGNATDILAFDGGGGAATEVLVSATACPATSNNACLLLLPDVSIDPKTRDLLVGTRQFFALPATPSPRILLRGDFDGDDQAEVLVVGADGQLQCVRASGGVVTPC